MDSVCGHTHDLGGGLRPFGAFPNANDYRLHYHLSMPSGILKAMFVFFIGGEFVVFIYPLTNTGSVNSFIILDKVLDFS